MRVHHHHSVRIAEAAMEMKRIDKVLRIPMKMMRKKVGRKRDLSRPFHRLRSVPQLGNLFADFHGKKVAWSEGQRSPPRATVFMTNVEDLEFGFR